MPGRLEEIGKINVQITKSSSPDQPTGESRFDVRDEIVERIRRIAGKDSIKRIVPIQSEGDRKTQDINFDMEEASYLATITYNNALTEGWVSDLKKYPKKC
ncbi:hypothetical protein [Methanocella sp. MCL-LM]|uniref:hypothetical protein n=1 Tax=Methanocella sp. MCL-LM TaxID=3412035 RepID=UPI003C70C5CF